MLLNFRGVALPRNKSASPVTEPRSAPRASDLLWNPVPGGSKIQEAQEAVTSLAVASTTQRLLCSKAGWIFSARLVTAGEHQDSPPPASERFDNTPLAREA